MVTTVPTLPLVGEKLRIVGVTLKVPELVADPPVVVTVIFPVLAALGGIAATTFAVVSDLQITATVPTGAITGKIAVTTSGGTATTSATFTVTS